MTLQIPSTLPAEAETEINAIIARYAVLSDEEIVKPLEDGWLQCTNRLDGSHSIQRQSILSAAVDAHLCISEYKLRESYAEAERDVAEQAARRKCKLVMKRLNGEWKPDWNTLTQRRFSLFFVTDGALRVTELIAAYNEWVFKDEATAQRFIRLCGDDIKTLWGIGQ